MKAYKMTTLCLAGFACLSLGGLKVEAAGLSTGINAGIASVLSEAYSTNPYAEQDIVEILTPSAFDGICIAQVDNYVNIRSLPNEESEVVGKLYDKSAGTIEEETDGWYKITSGNVTGYVKCEYVATGDEAEALAQVVGERTAVVNTETLRVRSEASIDASVLGLVPQGEELSVEEEADGFVKVSIEEGDGWVSTEFVELKTDFIQAESKQEEEERLASEEAAREDAAKKVATATATAKSSEATEVVVGSGSGSSSGNAVVNYACRFVGNPYVYGGTSLTNGTDCSGFVMSVYANFGISLPHSSSAMRSVGYGVSLADAQPGDIICYSGHVAIYCGNNTVVHASTAATGIKYSSPANYKSVLAVRRIF